MKKSQKSHSGITLVALVITIIFLMILAGISIASITQTGLFSKTQQAKESTDIANIEEQIQLEIYKKQLENNGDISDQELKIILEKYGKIEYEEDEVTIKGIKTKEGYEILLSDIYSGEILEEKLVANGNYQKVKGVNSPQLLIGMEPIKFTDPTETEEGTTVTTTVSDSNWYNYNSQKWANARTKDGSMWVWIPRYAYRINSDTQTCDIVFLIGTTDNYYDENGNIQTAKRPKKASEIVDTTTGYTVHPAFLNESSINYANGGWDKELPGIWVAKFGAGYATGNNTTTKSDGTAYTKDNVPVSSVKYTQSTVWGIEIDPETGTYKEDDISARNWMDGIYGDKETRIKYPTFQGLTYSMNYININDAYLISKALTENGNIYGLSASNADSHLMKNSEWGAVAYLSKSKYGLNGTNIYINNVSLNNSISNVYSITGCCGVTEDADIVMTTIDDINNRTASNMYIWTQKNGQKASSTGTIYGIYDLSGGLWEMNAALVANGNENTTKFGSSLLNNGASDSTSTKYVTVYPSNDKGITDYDTAANINYELNKKIYGDAVRETSTAGTGQTSWYLDVSCFTCYYKPFFTHGGYYWPSSGSGLFSFMYADGNAHYGFGFRSVLVVK